MKTEFKSNPLYSNQTFLANVWDHKDQQLLVDALSWAGKGMAPEEYWMTFPAHGYLLADTYKRPVVLFSDDIQAVFLPLSYPPTTTVSPIRMILIKNIRHIISFNFKSGIWPSPQVHFFWNSYVQPDAVTWQDLIQPNLDLGQQVLYAPKRRSARLNNIVSVDSD